MTIHLISSADYEHATAEIEVLSWKYYFNLDANISAFLVEDQISVVLIIFH